MTLRGRSSVAITAVLHRRGPDIEPGTIWHCVRAKIRFSKVYVLYKLCTAISSSSAANENVPTIMLAVYVFVLLASSKIAGEY